MTKRKIKKGWYRYAGFDLTSDHEYGWVVWHGNIGKIAHAPTINIAIKGINKLMNRQSISIYDCFTIKKPFIELMKLLGY